MKLALTPTWIIRLVALWAIVLALLAFAYLLVLSSSVDFISDTRGTQTQVWTVFVLNLLFGVGFTSSSYGLWTHHNWGRVLFLWTIVLWAGFSLIGLFAPGLLFGAERTDTPASLAVNGLRYAATLGLPLWYLNIPRVKAHFSGGKLEDSFSGSDDE